MPSGVPGVMFLASRSVPTVTDLPPLPGDLTLQCPQQPRPAGTWIAAGVMVLIEVVALGVFGFALMVLASWADEDRFGGKVLAVVAVAAAVLITSAIGLFRAKRWARVVVIGLHGWWLLAQLVVLAYGGDITQFTLWAIAVVALTATGRSRPRPRSATEPAGARPSGTTASGRPYRRHGVPPGQ